MRILDFGSLNIDYVYGVDHIVAPGETLASTQRSVFPGGKGLNQAVALARAGARVWQAGMMGPEGGLLLDVCRDAGVDTHLVARSDVATGHTVIQVDAKGQNCILLYGGANRQVDEGYVDQVLAQFSAGDYLVLQNEISCLAYLVDRASALGMKVILNPSPYDDALRAVDLGKVSLFILNEIEGAQISGGSTDPADVLGRLGEQYPQAEVVLTLGARGSVYQCGGHRYEQGIFEVEVIDTTAAGDTFTGYFVWARSVGKPVQEALALAAKASAMAVSQQGAVPSIPTMEQVRASPLG